jgi:RNA binding exosome subunit
VRKLHTDGIEADYVHTWERRLDDEEGIIHFRLAKQPLLEGRVELESEGGEGDLVKLELKLLAYPAKAESYRKVAENLFEID